MAIPPISPTDFVSRRFDYLIIGGGTAGLCVAVRLSEDPDISVGVLEAGGVHLGEKAIDVPGRYGEGIGSAFDWQYETTPQSGLRGRTLPWPRGKLLGGTSALNFMTWNRPNREDLDAWAALGNEGWSWDEML
jgi:choline dehydrogenase-like flavoprotein